MRCFLIFLGGIGLMVITSFNILFKGNSEQGEMICWINLQYEECLKNKLPCDCEKSSMPYFTLIVDTTSKSSNSGFYCLGNNQMEFYQWDIKKQSNASFQILRDINDVTSLIGLITFKGDKLYFIDEKKTKSVFKKFGRKSNQRNNSQYVFEKMSEYRKQNIVLLNKSFKKRKYENVEKIVGRDSLTCDCNKELGGINLITSARGSWILEEKKDSLFLYDFVNIGDDKTEPPVIHKRLFKKFKW